MTKPIDIVRCFHNAFRRDTHEIDDSALQVARNGGDITRVLSRLHIMGEILEYHARGEEEAVFPAFDRITPSSVKVYLLDHRELDTMVNGLEMMRAAPDALALARATAVLSSHLRIHLYKEDAYLYPILKEQTTENEQASIVGIMASKIPQDKTPTLIRWLFPLLNNDDRVLVINGWTTLMPPKVFAGLKPFIQETISEDWAELTKRVPELAT